MNAFPSTIRLASTVFIALSLAAPAGAGVDVLTRSNDAARSGANLEESRLNTTTVKASFRKLCSRPIDGDAYAQPLYASNVAIAGRPPGRNAVIVATENNTVFAFNGDDTDQDSATYRFWKSAQLGTPVPAEELSLLISPEKGPGGCVNLTPQIGITSTPVISPDKKTIYVVAKTVLATNPKLKTAQYLHALNMLDGKPARPPVLIEGEVPGVGVGSQGGRITFDSDLHLNRASLLLHNGVIYVGFGGHCDTAPYHGWLFAYDAATLAMIDVLNTTPNDTAQFNPGEGAIWQSGQGPAADEHGNIYVVTGNGSNNASKLGGLGTDFGDSVLRIRLDAARKLQVDDWFTPPNQKILNIDDADLGSTGPVLLPDSHLLVAAGKEGRLYLLDRDSMGKGLAPPLDSFQVTYGPLTFFGFPRTYWNIHGSPMTWRRGDRMSLYIWGEEDKLKQYTLVKDPGPAGWKFLGYEPAFLSSITAAMPKPLGDGSSPSREGKVFMPGGMLSFSADHEKEGTGIVWSSMPVKEDAVNQVVRGVLRAFDAGNVGLPELWNSEMNPGDSVGMFAKFCPPTVADGKVFLPGFAEETIDDKGVHHVFAGGLQPALVVYGLR